MGHLTARPLMATTEGDDEMAVMRLTIDDLGSWRCGDYPLTCITNDNERGLVNQVFLLGRRRFVLFFSLISDGSTLKLWGSEDVGSAMPLCRADV